MTIGVAAIVAFVTVFGAASARPQAADAPKVSQLGFLWLEPESLNPFPVFLEVLREQGYLEGVTVGLEPRYAKERAALPRLAADLVRRNVSVICTFDEASTGAAMAATSRIPIVFSLRQVVEQGYVARLRRSAKNLTGVLGGYASFETQLEALKGAVPEVARIALLWHPEPSRMSVDDIVRVLLPTVSVHNARVEQPKHMAEAFQAISKAKVQAVIVVPGEMTLAEGGRIADLALRNRMPILGPDIEAARAGALMSYAPNAVARYRRTVGLMARVLNGIPPATVPVVESEESDLVINLKTAKALKLTVPVWLRARADDLIE